MGVMSLFYSATYKKFNPNPNPNNYYIMDSKQIDSFLILKVRYYNCTNYEGKKILLFENCTINDIKKQKKIDPHFCDDKDLYYPIARFEPTEKGWKMAELLAYYL